MLYTFEGSLPRIRRQFAAMRDLADSMSEALFVPRPEISGWSVGEHLDHLGKVGGGILHLLAKDKPVEFRGVSLLGRVVLGAGWIPRGKAKAPEKMQGVAGTKEEIDSLLGRGEELLRQLAENPPRERRLPLVKHPYFGGLNAPQAARFVAVHNHHHLKIIRAVAAAHGRVFPLP